MLDIKLFVVFIYLNYVLCDKYCEICPDHTLCKYTVSGPSENCEGYQSARLTSYDVKKLLNRINEKRNFIALGFSRFFPQAANMNKIVWSNDLADSAQRWADQCDPAIRPDKEDECRDLETVKVGQNIATITGTSNGVLNVKNFVDIWFMQSMAYRGSVAYYNVSQNSKSNYFTQLIWASTSKVGCGRARFYLKTMWDKYICTGCRLGGYSRGAFFCREIVVCKIVDINHDFKVKGAPGRYVAQKNKAYEIDQQPVERLVCNFSPRGNIQRRPIYIIGYPSTQCNEGMVSDYEFTGLCSGIITETPDSVSSTSLLRIIYSVTSEIDPIGDNFNPIKDVTQRHRSQKLRHVYNNSFVLKRDDNNFWGVPPNSSRIDHDGLFQYKERGHSRVYHGHHHTHQLDYLHPNPNNNLRRYDYTTRLYDYTSREYSDEVQRRKDNQQCTRKTGKITIGICETATHFPLNVGKQCTRGQRNICNPVEQNSQPPVNPCENTQPPCPCSTPRITCATNPCAHNSNCKCFNVENPVNVCPDMRRNLNGGVHKEEITTEYFYDDSYVNKRLRNGAEQVKYLKPFSQIDEVSWKLNLNMAKKESTTKMQKFQQFSLCSDRKRRETDDPMTFKPFWQVDEFNKQHQLKSMRYTTLSNKKSRKRKPITSTALNVKLVTEPITIVVKSNIKHPTEKYLSFEELLRLRKINASEYNARRSDDATTAATVSEAESSTSEYTANTPFVRLKHCTRKLTCTWTAASLGENEGNADIAHRGSRTPPGYVEGCTRTSTCTRDYMNRNKMDTLPTPSTEVEADESNDEDYCEKRSLDLRRRNYNQDVVATEFPLPNTLVKRDDSEKEKENRNEQKEKDDSAVEYCNCNDFLRNKRENDVHKRYEGKCVLKRETESYNTLSYGDLFYLVLRKIIEKWNGNKMLMQGKCLCNSSVGIHYNVGLILILQII